MILIFELDLFFFTLSTKKYKTTEIVSLNSIPPSHVEGICINFFSLTHQKDFIVAETCWYNVDSSIVKIDDKAFLWKWHFSYLRIFILEQLLRKNKTMDRNDISSTAAVPYCFRWGADADNIMLLHRCVQESTVLVHSKLKKSGEREEKNDPSPHSPLCFSAMFHSY